MSTSEVVAGPPGVTSTDSAEVRSKPSYKSYKKKYRKMRHQFDIKMRESDNLYKDELKAIETIKKLEEQNDQLLELLLDLNSSSRVPAKQRFDLTSAALDLDHDGDLVSSTSTGPFKPIEVPPHTPLSPSILPEDLRASTPPGYLTPSHEDDYLYELDTRQGASPPPARPLSQLVKEKDKDNAREAQARNPVSVYNWLRKHQPQVFLQDKDAVPPAHGGKAHDKDKDTEAASEKSASATTASTRATKDRGAKRSSLTPAHLKAEQEFLDEELGGFVAESGTGGKGKRKRDDEPYRPKGGSSRPSKRKKEDGTPSGSRKINRKAGVVGDVS